MADKTAGKSDALHYRKHYYRDWAMSQTVKLMDFTARGIYMELLDAQWEKGHLPAIAAFCCKLAGCSAEEWLHFEEFLDTVFPLDEDGFRRNPRLKVEREQAVALSATRRNSGSNGGRTTASRKQTRTKREANATANGTQLPPYTDTDTLDIINPLTPSEKKPAKWWEDPVYPKIVRETAEQIAKTKLDDGLQPYALVSFDQAEIAARAMAKAKGKRERDDLWRQWHTWHGSKHTAYGVHKVGEAVADWAERNRLGEVRVRSKGGGGPGRRDALEKTLGVGKP